MYMLLVCLRFHFSHNVMLCARKCQNAHSTDVDIALRVVFALIIRQPDVSPSCDNAGQKFPIPRREEKVRFALMTAKVLYYAPTPWF